MRPVHANLKPYLHRINPRIQTAVEFITVEAEDKLAIQSDWDAATQSPGGNFDSFKDGTITLAESDISAISHTTSNDFITFLEPGTPFDSCQVSSDTPDCITPAVYAAIEFDSDVGQRVRIRKFKAWLTRNRAGGADYDGAFKLEFFTIVWYGVQDSFVIQGFPLGFDRDIAMLRPISDPVFVNARDSGGLAKGAPDWPGPSDTELVEFDLTNQFLEVGKLPIPELRVTVDDLNGRQYNQRIVLAKITTLLGTNTNYGWGINTAASFSTNGDYSLFQVNLLTVVGDGAFMKRRLAEPFMIIGPVDGSDSSSHRKAGQMRCELVVSQYPSGTSTIKKQLDLGSVPASAAAVEFGAIFDKPVGTTCNPQVSKDDIAAYVTFADGQTAADLSLPAQQTYFLRYQMVSDTNRESSPRGVELSVKEVARVDVTDLVRLSDGDYSIDPRNMRSEIRKITVDVIRDGSRDFLDRASRLAYENHPNALEIALYIRADKSTTPPRDEWMLIDVFSVIDSESFFGAERFTATSVLEKLKRDIPRAIETSPGSDVFLRTPIQFIDDSAATVFSTLLTEAQVGGRHKGQPPVNTLTDPQDGSTVTPSLTKDIIKLVEVKREMDRLALIMGGAVITRAGRIAFIEMFGEKSTVGFLSAEEIRVERTPRNLPERTISYRVPFGFDSDRDEFTSEVVTIDSDALANLGVPTIKRRSAELDDEAAKYLPDAEHARAVGFPLIKAFGGGVLFPWQLTSIIPHPEWEAGDMLGIETDRITVRDPIDNRGLKGRTFTKAVIAGSNPQGTRFTLWVRSFSDIINIGEESGGIGDLPNVPEILSTSLSETDGNVSGRKVKRCVVVDGETKEVHVYRRKDNWPTVDDTQIGQLDTRYRVRIMTGAFGWCHEGEGFVTDDVVHDIWVPANPRFKNPLGERKEYSYTVTGSSTPVIVSSSRDNTSVGTDCTTKRTVTLTWTTDGATDGAQDMKIYRSIIGGPQKFEPFILIKTEASPVTVTSYVADALMFEDSGGARLSARFRLDLVTGGTVEDTDTHEEDDIFDGVVCF